MIKSKPFFDREPPSMGKKDIVLTEKYSFCGRKENNNPYKIEKGNQNMTLIIGMKYKDGIVLIGDTKIVEGNNFHHNNKIEAPLEGIKVAVGSAGLTALSKDFNRKLSDTVAQRLREYEMANLREITNSPISFEDVQNGKKALPQIYVYNENKLLDDCAMLTKTVADTGRQYSQNPIESIVAVNVNTPLLYQIDCNGFKVDVPCVSIGSGTDHLGEYLKKNHDENMTLDEAVFLGTFLIKYVELLKFDNMVGLEDKKMPQVFILSKDFCDTLKFDEESTKQILSMVKSKIGKMRKELVVHPHYFKNEKSSSLFGEAKTKYK